MGDVVTQASNANNPNLTILNGRHRRYSRGYNTGYRNDGVYSSRKNIGSRNVISPATKNLRRKGDKVKNSVNNGLCVEGRKNLIS